MKNPTCQEISSLLPPLCFNEISEEKAATIHDHLAECDSCMSEYLALSLALQKSKTPFDDDELSLNTDQHQAIQRAAWASELAVIPTAIKKAKNIQVNPSSTDYNSDKKRFPWTVIAAVFVVVPILGAMLLPALGTARDKAQAKKIQNNLKMKMLEAEMVNMEEVAELAPPPPPPEIPPPEPQEIVSHDPTVSSDAVPDAADMVGAIDDASDEPPSTDDSAMADMVSDVKPSASSIVSSKMFGGRSSAGRAGALKSYGGNVRAPVPYSTMKDSDEDFELFEKEESEGRDRKESYDYAKERESKKQDLQKAKQKAYRSKAMAKAKKKSASKKELISMPIVETTDPFAHKLEDLSSSVIAELDSNDRTLVADNLIDDGFGDDGFGDDGFIDDGLMDTTTIRIPYQSSSLEFNVSSDLNKVNLPKSDSVDAFSKHNEVVIPTLTLKNESLESAVARIQQMANDYNPDPAKKDLKIILRINRNDLAGDAAAFAEDAVADDPFAEDIIDEIVDAAQSKPAKGVSLQLTNVPLNKAIELLALQNNLKVKHTENGIILAEKSVQLDTMEVRFYELPGEVLELLNESNLQSQTDINTAMRQHFVNQGINFDAGAQVSFIESVNRLVVNNTPEEHQKAKQLVDQLRLADNLKKQAEHKALVTAQQEKSARAKARQAVLEAQVSHLPDISKPAPIFFEGMVDTAENNKSTFAIDVDTASYTAARSEIRAGRKPRPSSIRLEEFINNFDYHYTVPTKEAFHIDSELTSHRVYGGVKLLRVGIQGQRVGADSKKPGSYTFVIDNSGSMAAEDRLPLIQKTLPAMFKRMNKNDEVTILTCENGVRTLVNRVKASQFERLKQAIETIETGAVANLSDGIVAAYKNASQNYQSGAVNRVILMSDGIASLGEDEADRVLGMVNEYREQGIGNTVIGVGSRDFDDNFLEQVSNKGDGAYYFGDTEEAMNTILVDNFDASFHTIARDVKIQVEFNPRAVRSYRLLGYEKRRLANKDFRNDKVDAGEVGAGQSVSALYEIVLSNEAQAGSLGQINLRYKQAEGDLVNELNNNLGLANQTSFRESSIATRLAWCASTFARLLKNNGQAEISFHALASEVDAILSKRPQDQKIQEFKELIIRCQGLY